MTDEPVREFVCAGWYAETRDPRAVKLKIGWDVCVHGSRVDPLSRHPGRGDGVDRHDDRIGLGVAANGLGDAHADYLAHGGIGFQPGDGRLRYRPETILESYYLFQALTWLALTVDYQFIADPRHNAARGPVSVVSLRLHLERMVQGGG
jgi:hypothetical protein